ncbi:rhombosortase [Alteromonas flava]|uniref:rhombosortase n=1 Tax=Alteromonas flava TaxID=2048003 RepID=UPI000C283893|nr:rhombosortase [Alteromonas flava]
MNRFVFATSPRFWIVPAFLAGVSILAWFFDPTASHAMAFSSAQINSGELYRLFTAHLMHTNLWHLLLNLAGLSLLWALHGDYYTPLRFAFAWAAISVITSLCLYIFEPNLLYVGMSGVLHGIFAWGACLDIRRGDKTGWLLLLGLGIKVGVEQLGGDTSDIAALIEASVAINAHAFGAIAGITWGTLGALKKPSVEG